jgi:2-polyprenyl-6-methoxyphenol hydroxylase-like FAD-dependent oxidoreductase
VVRELETEAQCEEEKFNGIPWGPERAIEMMQEIKEFKIPFGQTLGNLFEHTPQEAISRVYLEDKLFKTWTHGRVVLIGDAAHKVYVNSTTFSTGY